MPADYVLEFDHTDKIAEEIQTKMELAIAKAAFDCQRIAQKLVPVDTGFLRSSIQAAHVGNAAWDVVVGAEYGGFVEFGTHRSSGRPYLTPAFNMAAARLTKALKQLGVKV